MAGNVYSTYELAKTMADERMKELETDIFICKSTFRSGEEFTLKTRGEMMKCNTYLHVIGLPFRHRFKSKPNAEREASMLASRKGRPVYVKKRTEIENGYIKIRHYYLTYKEPCLA